MHGPHPHPRPDEFDENAPLELRLMSAFFRFMHTPWHRIPAPGISRAETGILLTIMRAGDFGRKLRVRDLSREMHVSSPTVTQHLNSLEEQGFVRRVQSRDDRREVYLELTEKGSEELDAHRAAMEQNMRELVENLGEENAGALERLLRQTSDFFFEKDKTYRD